MFAHRLGKRLGGAADEGLQRLWGEHFYDSDVKKWCVLGIRMGPFN